MERGWDVEGVGVELCVSRMEYWVGLWRTLTVGSCGMGCGQGMADFIGILILLVFQKAIGGEAV